MDGLGQAGKGRMFGVEKEWIAMIKLAPFGCLVSFPGATDAAGEFLGPISGSHDAGFVDGNDTAAAIYKGLKHGELFVGQVGEMEILD